MQTTYTITPEGVAVFYEGRYHNIPQTHTNYPSIVEALRAGRFELLPDLLDLPKAVEEFFAGEPEFAVRGGLITYRNTTFPEACSHKALALLKEGNDPKPLVNFLRKLADATPVAQADLLDFCVANGLLIYEDGDILAFKGVRSDYTDQYSGTVSNKIGDTPPRLAPWQVDADRSVPCSFGYHVGSMSYANGYGTRTMIVKVDPRDWIAVPNETEVAKGRVTSYVVLAEMDREQPLPVRESYSDDDFEYDEDDEDDEFDNN